MNGSLRIAVAELSLQKEIKRSESERSRILRECRIEETTACFHLEEVLLRDAPELNSGLRGYRPKGGKPQGSVEVAPH